MNRRVSLAIYTVSHFLVDFACFVVLYGSLAAKCANSQACSALFLTYNIIAFGLQPFIGYWLDCKKSAQIGAIAGFVLVMAGCVLFAFPYIAMPLAALGNACFHVGAGKHVLENCEGRMADSGVFVSSGALGVSLGTLAGKSYNLPIWALLTAFAVLLALAFIFCRDRRMDFDWRFNLGRARVPAVWIMGLCLASVCIRAFAGGLLTAPDSLRTLVWLSLAPSALACLGKMSGGFLADRFGARGTAAVSLASAAVLLGFFSKNAVCFLVGLGLFNMSMSITLCAIAAQIPEMKGFAFGLTTLALLAGTVPIFYVRFTGAASSVLVPLLTLVSCACLLIALGGVKRREKDE